MADCCGAWSVRGGSIGPWVWGAARVVRAAGPSGFWVVRVAKWPVTVTSSPEILAKCLFLVRSSASVRWTAAKISFSAVGGWLTAVVSFSMLVNIRLFILVNNCNSQARNVVGLSQSRTGFWHGLLVEGSGLLVACGGAGAWVLADSAARSGCAAGAGLPVVTEAGALLVDLPRSRGAGVEVFGWLLPGSSWDV